MYDRKGNYIYGEVELRRGDTLHQRAGRALGCLARAMLVLAIVAGGVAGAVYLTGYILGAGVKAAP